MFSHREVLEIERAEYEEELEKNQKRYCGDLCKKIEALQNINKQIENVLRGLISVSLGQPSGDPDKTHLCVASIAYQALEKFGFDVSKYSKGDNDTLELIKETNRHQCNFLDFVDWQGKYKRQGKYKK